MREKGDIVCIDAHVLIWGIKRQAGPGKERLVERAEYFLEKCQKEGTKILLPSIVLSEVMAGTPPETATALARVLQKRFMVAPFDTPAAMEFGKMWYQWKEKHPSGSIAQEGFLRQKFKVDHMILATAVARGAWCIYTHDDDMRKLSNGLIEVSELPQLPPRQGKLL